MRNAEAGKILSFFQSKLKTTIKTRKQVQCVFVYAFFDSCCFKSSSPFHEMDACPNTLPDLGSDFRHLRQELHILNHPLTDEQKRERMARFLAHTGSGFND